MLYAEWYPRYLETYKRSLKPKTRESYDYNHRRYIAPVLGGLELSEITPEHIQEAINLAADHGSRQSQICYALMHAVLRRAARSRLISWNPADAIDKPAHDQERGIALTEADYQAVLPYVVDDLGSSLALFAGLRRGELLGLQWGDVDLSGEVIHVRRSRVRSSHKLQTQTTKSRTSVRDVPISPELLPILRAEYRLSPSAWVLPCAPETLARRWKRVQADAGLSAGYRLHDLRHTYGTRLILAGCNVRVVQYCLGHSSLEVTARIYSHCAPSDAKTEVFRVYGFKHCMRSTVAP